MKNALKTATRELAHVVSEDTFPMNNPRPTGTPDIKESYHLLPPPPADPTPDEIHAAEEDFRSFIQSRMTSPKAPAHLLQKIRLSISQLEENRDGIFK